MATDACGCPAEAGAETCDLRGDMGGGNCPSCRERGKRVDLLTLKALLAVPLTEIQHSEYFFCRSARCPTVYFSAGGEQEFAEPALRERVYQKHVDDGEVFVCYCFRHSVSSVRESSGDSGESAVVRAITEGIQRGQCACEIRNPQGNCCLGNVRAVHGSRAAIGTP